MFETILSKNGTILSKVPGFEGECRPTWVNRNEIYLRVDGGVSGFFRLTKRKWGITFKVGKEFHGIVRWGRNFIESTKTVPKESEN